MEATALSKRVRERADKDELPIDHELRVRADQFDAATYSELKGPKQLVGYWARLRRAWCEYSGEPLL